MENKIFNPSLKAFTFFTPPILLLSSAEFVPNLRPAFYAYIGSSTQKLKSLDIKLKSLAFDVLPIT